VAHGSESQISYEAACQVFADWATRAAGPCSSSTSPRAGPRLTGRTCHRGARPGSCSLRPHALAASQQEVLTGLTAACPEMTALASLVRSFAALLAPHPRNARRLQKWITAARTASLPHVHAFTRGLDLDSRAATAALTLPHHNDLASHCTSC